MNHGKKRLPYILISLSLIFLLLFLITWNIDNYRNEKSELRNELSQQMTLACSAYRDSIVQDIFQVLSIQKRPNINLTHTPRFPELTNDTSYFETFVIASSTDEAPSNISIALEISDSTLTTRQSASESVIGIQERIVAWRSDSSHSFTFEVPGDSLWRSYENDTSFFIPSTLSRLNTHRGQLPKSYLDIDSIFTKKLNQQNLPSDHVVLRPDSVGDLKNDGINIIFEYDSFSFRESARPYAHFSNLSTFLFKKILTPLLGSTLLFGLVALSFYFIISRWKEEERAARLRREFMSNMTHELKTPLATVGIALEALDNYGVIEDREKSREYIDISRKEVGRLGLLVDKVLKMTALENGLGRLNLETIDMNMLLRDIINSMKVYFENTKTRVNLDIANDLVKINGDKVHITNVFYNLIDNAVKYSEDQPHLFIGAQTKDDKVEIVIKDQGMGIPKEYHKKVFDRLFRVPTNDVHNSKGHGLGLHYVKQVIDQHKGKIELESQLGFGSTFTIHIPSAS